MLDSQNPLGGDPISLPFTPRRLTFDLNIVGFSAVLFGLKVVLNYSTTGWSSVMGIQVPVKYLCWAELVVASLINPNASFLGHLTGIAAGFFHVKVKLIGHYYTP